MSFRGENPQVYVLLILFFVAYQGILRFFTVPSNAAPFLHCCLSTGAYLQTKQRSPVPRAFSPGWSNETHLQTSLCPSKALQGPPFVLSLFPSSFLPLQVVTKKTVQMD